MARAMRLLTSLALLLAMPTQARAWELGQSGLHLQRTPHSLIVTHVEVNSPAYFAAVPFARDGVQQLEYVNGLKATDLLRGGELGQAFASTSVRVTLRVREAGQLESHLVGPFQLSLRLSPAARLQRHVRSQQWVEAAALARSGALPRGVVTSFWARVALEAQTCARAESWEQAMMLARLVPGHDPAAPALHASLPYWQTLANRSGEEARKLLGREHWQPGSNARRIAERKQRLRAAANEKEPG